MGYICGGSFIILLLLGITNTIVVYKDESDFIFSLAVIIVPVVTFFALAYLSPEDPPDSYNIFWEDTPHKIISSIGVTLTLLSMLKTLLNLTLLFQQQYKLVPCYALEKLLKSNLLSDWNNSRPIPSA